MQKTDNGFYSPMHAIDYNRPAIITTGHRSGGKSTGWARFFLLNYIYNKRKFFYVRRTKDEFDLTKDEFFTKDAIPIINNADLGFKITYFACTGGVKNRFKMTIDWDNVDYTPEKYTKDGDKVDMTEEEIADARQKDILNRAVDVGGGTYLQRSQKAKSGYDFTDIDWIYYDEFIAEEASEYLGSVSNHYVEYKKIISLFVSCDRERGKYFSNRTHIVLSGNKADTYNPIILKWGINKYICMSPEAKIIAPKNEGWVYEEVQPSQAYIEAAKKSNAYLLMDEEERAYNIGNKARAGNEGKEWVAEVPHNAYYKKGIILEGVEYGIYEYNNIMYIGKCRPGQKMQAYDIASASHHDANMIVMNWKQDPVMFSIYYKFTKKQLFFYSQDSARAFLQYLQFIPK